MDFHEAAGEEEERAEEEEQAALSFCRDPVTLIRFLLPRLDEEEEELNADEKEPRLDEEEEEENADEKEKDAPPRFFFRLRVPRSDEEEEEEEGARLMLHQSWCSC